MYTYKIVYEVDHNRSEEVIKAESSSAAEKLIKSRYASSNVRIVNNKRID